MEKKNIDSNTTRRKTQPGENIMETKLQILMVERRSKKYQVLP